MFTDDTPSALILQLRPRIYIRGPDYAGVELPEQYALDQVGTKLIIHQSEKIHNASSLVDVAPSSIFESKIVKSWKDY